MVLENDVWILYNSVYYKSMKIRVYQSNYNKRYEIKTLFIRIKIKFNLNLKLYYIDFYII